MSDIVQAVGQAFTLYQQGRVAEATNLCLRIVERSSMQADALYLLAIINAQAQHFVEANAYFERAIAAAPDRAELYGNYAAALREQGRNKDAVIQSQLSLNIDEKRIEVHITLSTALLAQGDLTAAIAACRQVLALDLAQYATEINLANALLVQKHYDEAITCYRRVITQHPHRVDAHYGLALALKDKGQIDEARAAFETTQILAADYKSTQKYLFQLHPNWKTALNGERVCLLPLAACHAQYLLACYQNTVFMDQYHLYAAKDQSLTSLQAQLRQLESEHPAHTHKMDWIIMRQTAGGRRPMGIASLVEIQFDHQRAELMIGFPANADRHGRPAVEAALLIFDFAFRQTGLNKLTSFVYGNNPNAQHNTLALGFQQEGYLREQIKLPGDEKFIGLYSNGYTACDYFTNARLQKLSRRLMPPRPSNRPSTAS